ncbi:hypothetical protein [Streptomyces acidiscabies]|uniref:hypothetical protein n=1 Tax=Streptomyces acidiscabies TaxID=42234 RepID=UPI001F3AD0A4|nr:hypothetical protein [Streptomyces acidiscabies]
MTSLLPTPSTSENTGPGHAAQGGMNLRHVVSLLPTPRASENENRQTKRSPSQEAGTHGKSLAAEMGSLLPTPTATDSERQSTTYGRGNPTLRGELTPDPAPAPTSGSTARRSRAGKPSADAPPPGQLTLWDA